MESEYLRNIETINSKEFERCYQMFLDNSEQLVDIDDAPSSYLEYSELMDSYSGWTWLHERLDESVDRAMLSPNWLPISRDEYYEVFIDLGNPNFPVYGVSGSYKWNWEITVITLSLKQTVNCISGLEALMNVNDYFNKNQYRNDNNIGKYISDLRRGKRLHEFGNLRDNRGGYLTDSRIESINGDFLVKNFHPVHLHALPDFIQIKKVDIDCISSINHYEVEDEISNIKNVRDLLAILNAGLWRGLKYLKIEFLNNDQLEIKSSFRVARDGIKIVSDFEWQMTIQSSSKICHGYFKNYYDFWSLNDKEQDQLFTKNSDDIYFLRDVLWTSQHLLGILEEKVYRAIDSSDKVLKRVISMNELVDLLMSISGKFINDSRFLYYVIPSLASQSAYFFGTKLSMFPVYHKSEDLCLAFDDSIRLESNKGRSLAELIDISEFPTIEKEENEILNELILSSIEWYLQRIRFNIIYKKRKESDFDFSALDFLDMNHKDTLTRERAKKISFLKEKGVVDADLGDLNHFLDWNTRVLSKSIFGKKMTSWTMLVLVFTEIESLFNIEIYLAPLRTSAFVRIVPNTDLNKIDEKFRYASLY